MGAFLVCISLDIFVFSEPSVAAVLLGSEREKSETGSQGSAFLRVPPLQLSNRKEERKNERRKERKKEGEGGRKREKERESEAGTPNSLY